MINYFFFFIEYFIKYFIVCFIVYFIMHFIINNFFYLQLFKLINYINIVVIVVCFFLF